MDSATRPNTTAAPSINLADAARFLKLLDPNAAAFEFRTFDDDKDRKDENLTRTFFGALAQHTVELQRLNDKGAGVFVTINETNGIGRKAKHIIRVRAVFIDLDGAPLPPVMAIRSKPHIVVETSPGKFHCYWLVEGMPLDDFNNVQKALIELFQIRRRYSRFAACHAVAGILPSQTQAVFDPCPQHASHAAISRGIFQARTNRTTTSQLRRQGAGDGNRSDPRRWSAGNYSNLVEVERPQSYRHDDLACDRRSSGRFRRVVPLAAA